MRSFTLLELIIVVLIIAVAAGAGLVNYNSYKERNYNKEPASNLRTIIQAERMFFVENNAYSANANSAAINTNLRLSLDTAGTPIWNYRTTVGGGSACCAQATRNVVGGRTLRMRLNEDDPVSGGCP